MKLITLTQGTPEWHAWRRNGIGGSDAPVVLDASPYRTKRQLYVEKFGTPEEQEEDEDKEFIFGKGHKVERLIRGQFEAHLGVELMPICVEHDQHGIIRASLDGFHPMHGVLEAKLVGQAVLEAARSKGEIPEHHNIQIQHGLIATGADVGSWFGHDGKKNGVAIEVRADKSLAARLIEEELALWDQFTRGIVPALSDRDYLHPDDDKLLRELRDAKEHAENAEEAFKRLKDAAIQTYGHAKIAGGGLKIYQTNRAGSLDVKSIPEVQALLATLDPEYVNGFQTKGSVSWTVRIDQAPKQKRESA